MGYPIEIANAMPGPRAVPLSHPLTGWWGRLKSWWTQRRRRRRADHPHRYTQGVDPRWPPIPPGSSGHLDIRAVERHLQGTDHE